MKVSIIIPVYNEFRTLPEVLERVRDAQLPPGTSRQIIVVDDGSTDGTSRLLSTYAGDSVVVHHSVLNFGKGTAIRIGLTKAVGEIILIQDGDLEYDPNDYSRLVAPILEGRADIVYGSRFRASVKGMAWKNWLANRILTLASNFLYGASITDEATAYKAFRTDVLKRVRLDCKRFEFCPEVTAKLSRLGYSIQEVPISYNPRRIVDGKKIKAKDGFQALWILLRYRVTPRRAFELAAAEETRYQPEAIQRRGSTRQPEASSSLVPVLERSRSVLATSSATISTMSEPESGQPVSAGAEASLNGGPLTTPQPGDQPAQSKKRAKLDYWIAGSIVLLVLGFAGRVGRGIFESTPKPENAQAAQKANQFINLGMTLYNAKKFPAAEALFRQATQADPNSALAYNDLGAVLNDQQRWDEAITALQKAVALNPTLDLARNNLAFSYSRRAHGGRPDDPAAAQAANQHINAGMGFYSASNFPAAEAEFRQAIQVDPTSALAYNDLGATLNNQQRWDEAITVLRKAVELNPSLDLARNNLAFSVSQKAKGGDGRK